MTACEKVKQIKKYSSRSIEKIKLSKAKAQSISPAKTSKAVTSAKKKDAKIWGKITFLFASVMHKKMQRAKRANASPQKA